MSRVNDLALIRAHVLIYLFELWMYNKIENEITSFGWLRA